MNHAENVYVLLSFSKAFILFNSAHDSILYKVLSNIQYYIWTAHYFYTLILHTNFTNFTHYNILFTDHTEEITIDSGIKGPAVLDQIVEVDFLLSLFLFKNHFFNFSSCKIVDKLTTKLFDHLFDRFWHIGFFYLTNWTHV